VPGLRDKQIRDLALGANRCSKKSPEVGAEKGEILSRAKRERKRNVAARRTTTKMTLMARMTITIKMMTAATETESQSGGRTGEKGEGKHSGSAPSDPTHNKHQRAAARTIRPSG